MLNLPENGRKIFHPKNEYNELKKAQRIVNGKFVVFQKFVVLHFGVKND